MINLYLISNEKNISINKEASFLEFYLFSSFNYMNQKLFNILVIIFQTKNLSNFFDEFSIRKTISNVHNYKF